MNDTFALVIGLLGAIGGLGGVVSLVMMFVQMGYYKNRIERNESDIRDLRDDFKKRNEADLRRLETQRHGT